MNIFFLHYDPKKCVELYVDKHVIKMLLESVQILCSVHHMCNEIEINFIPPYKLSHKNHPCCIWARKSLSNYIWLTKLTKELSNEYTYRYGKIHKCEKDGYIDSLIENKPNIPDIGFTTPSQAMPDMYKIETNNMDDVIEAYKHYYFFEKSNIHCWKKRDIPEFIIEFKKIFEDL